MAIRLIIDSASDILPEEAKALGIIHLPLQLRIDDWEYLDGVTLMHKEFYEKLIESAAFPVTSQITPGQYTDAIREVVGAGDTAFIITLSSRLSGTYQSACIAAAEYPGQAFVVDSLNATIGERLLILYAHRLIEQGITAEALAAELEEARGKIRLLAVLDTLVYLKKGGRISAATAFAGDLLSIKPVVTVKDGAVILCGKARGSKNSGNQLRKLVNESRGIDFTRPYATAYSGLSDAMIRKYIADNADLWSENIELH